MSESVRKERDGMKTFKLTLFNPITTSVRRFVYTFEWDYTNHCWFTDGFGAYWGNPINAVKHMGECLCRKGEYVTIKEVAR